MGKDAVSAALAEKTHFERNPRGVTRGQDSQDASGTSSVASADVLGIHWLRGSFAKSEKTWLRDKMCVLWGELYEECEYGFWTYDRHLLWPCGVKLLFHSMAGKEDLTAGRIAVEIQGAALDGMDLWQTLLLMTSFWEHGFQCSRLDVYLDDHHHTVTPMSLYQLVYEESLFEGDPIRHDVCGFQRVKKITESNRKGRIHDEICFGRRGKLGTGKYLRVYDKNRESKGLIDAVRWELELSDHYAKGAFEKIVMSLGSPAAQSEWRPEWTTRVLGGLIAWAVDFKIRVPGEKNLARLERYPFWQAILNRLGYAALAGRRIVKTMERSVEWVSRAVGGTLQMLRMALGDETAIPMVVELMCGERKLRSAHRRAIVEYQRQEGGGIHGFGETIFGNRYGVHRVAEAELAVL